MTRTHCSACGSPDLEIFLDLGRSPIADAYTAMPDEVSPTFPLQVAVCGKCRLVQLLEVVPAGVLFGSGYSFYSSASAPLSAYHKTYAADVLDRYGEQAARGVLEIGSNDGDLLQHFKHLPHLGIDPSSGPVRASGERGCAAIRATFGLQIAQEIELGMFPHDDPAGVVIANHVLAHVEDVSDTLAGIAHLMDDASVALVEVQYLPDLLVNNAFDLVYHEHRNFFSLTTLEAAAAQHGLFVVDACLTDRQGGSVRATLAKTGGAMVRTTAASQILADERWLDDFSAYAGMQGRAERIRTRLRDLISASEHVSMIGAPAKATTLLNFCELTSADISWCTDSTQAKQGRHIPGTGIPIYAFPPGVPATVLIGAWNYAREIMCANPGRRFIVPLPAPVVLG